MEPNRLLDEIATSLNARDWASYGRVFASDLIVHAPGLQTTGREARVQWVQNLIVAFPDGRIAVERVFADGDFICAELRFTGTQTGPLNSPRGTVPATHRKVTFPYCLVLRTNGQEIAELHEYFDQLELLTQLGLIAQS
jgi:predicted ester cyclase